MATYEEVHAGDLVLGHDNQVWGVETVVRVPHLSVTLRRHGARMTGWPPAGTEVTIVQRADVTADYAAAAALIDGGLGPLEIVSEYWTT